MLGREKQVDGSTGWGVRVVQRAGSSSPASLQGHWSKDLKGEAEIQRGAGHGRGSGKWRSQNCPL